MKLQVHIGMVRNFLELINMVNKKIRCAIYTRKSCEEGLEQDFNSLDAQREACESYIKSQVHEGWSLISTHYDDGGFSGGTIERPAFKQLLEDIKQDKIDIVVVYKVDRLTRSIMDFAKIIDVFDSHNASFVSITQHFNTTTSMGRLTLNILLSFAQFEREVTGERIRDKFEATRKKGLWIFGKPPYGYTKDEHNVLIPEEPYTENVRKIFNLYLEFGSVDKLFCKLKELNIKSRSGKEIARGLLYKMLSNKVYIGKFKHKDKEYDGQHKPIIDIETFNTVQNLLLKNATNKKHALYSKDGSLLTGLLFDDVGNKMSPSHSNKNGKKYRYYMVYKHKVQKVGNITKLPAGEIETFVKDCLHDLIQDKKTLQKYVENESISTQDKILNLFNTFECDKLFIRNSINRIDIQLNEIKITYNFAYIISYLKAIINNTQVPLVSDIKQLETLKYSVNIALTPQKQNKIIIQGKINYDLKLINAIVQSFWFNEKCANGELSREEKISGNNKRFKNLRFLPPNIIENIINGKNDENLTVKDLLKLVA